MSDEEYILLEQALEALPDDLRRAAANQERERSIGTMKVFLWRKHA